MEEPGGLQSMGSLRVRHDWATSLSLFTFMHWRRRSKRLLISWLQSPSAVILEPRKIKSVTVSTVSPSICHEVMGPNAISLDFECWIWSQIFHSPLSPSSRGSLVLLHLCHKGGIMCISEVIDISPGILDSSLCFIKPGTSYDIL